mmetsp:Transcript_16600/g.62842  ORF Transcript_16600/g.62842 Transcript_16600/m.62842 type:complete len:479 (+) Transcript_16600:158-1594(+)
MRGTCPAGNGDAPVWGVVRRGRSLAGLGGEFAGHASAFGARAARAAHAAPPRGRGCRVHGPRLLPAPGLPSTCRVLRRWAQPERPLAGGPAGSSWTSPRRPRCARAASEGGCHAANCELGRRATGASRTDAILMPEELLARGWFGCGGPRRRDSHRCAGLDSAGRASRPELGHGSSSDNHAIRRGAGHRHRAGRRIRLGRTVRRDCGPGWTLAVRIVAAGLPWEHGRRSGVPDRPPEPGGRAVLCKQLVTHCVAPAPGQPRGHSGRAKAVRGGNACGAARGRCPGRRLHGLANRSRRGVQPGVGRAGRPHKRVERRGLCHVPCESPHGRHFAPVHVVGEGQRRRLGHSSEARHRDVNASADMANWPRAAGCSLRHPHRVFGPRVGNGGLRKDHHKPRSHAAAQAGRRRHSWQRVDVYDRFGRWDSGDAAHSGRLRCRHVPHHERPPRKRLDGFASRLRPKLPAASNHRGRGLAGLAQG